MKALADEFLKLPRVTAGAGQQCFESEWPVGDTVDLLDRPGSGEVVDVDEDRICIRLLVAEMRE